MLVIGRTRLLKCENQQPMPPRAGCVFQRSTHIRSTRAALTQQTAERPHECHSKTLDSECCRGQNQQKISYTISANERCNGNRHRRATRFQKWQCVPIATASSIILLLMNANFLSLTCSRHSDIFNRPLPCLLCHPTFFNLLHPA